MTLQSLITKLERSDSGSRELDAEIWLATTEGATRRTTTVKSATNLWAPYDIDETRDATGRLIIVPSYTESLDAAVALVNRLLPDFTCPIHGERLRSELRQDIDWTDITDVDLRPSGRPALALCISLLVAIEAVNEGTYKAPQAPAAKAGTQVRTIGKTEPSVESGANRTSSLEKDEAEVALRALSKDNDHDHK